MVTVYYRGYTKKYKVRPTSGISAKISFGEYRSLAEAKAIGKQVDQLRSRAAAFRLREELGIKGRGRLAQEQRNQMSKDRYEESGRRPKRKTETV
jgi:hypothetical protein